QAADERGDERFSASVWFATSELETRAGNWAEAARRAEQAVERSRQAGLATAYVWSRYTQALVDAHLGHVQPARDAAADAHERAQTLDRISARAAVGRCRGLRAAAAGEFALARAGIEEALRQHARLNEPFELGRTLLAQGSIERRALQRSRARVLLSQALELF